MVVFVDRLLTLCLVRYVILGNHRDAWSFGAVDPNSGTAVLLEVRKVLLYAEFCF